MYLGNWLFNNQVIEIFIQRKDYCFSDFKFPI